MIITVRQKHQLLSQMLPSSLGLPGPHTASPSEADPRARHSFAGCPGAGSAGEVARWSLERCCRGTFFTAQLSSCWTGVPLVCELLCPVLSHSRMTCSTCSCQSERLCPGCSWHSFFCGGLDDGSVILVCHQCVTLLQLTSLFHQLVRGFFGDYFAMDATASWCPL